MSKRISKQSKNEVMNFKHLGFSNTRIASKLDISEGSVRNILKEKNYNGKVSLPGRKKILSQKEERMIIRKYDSGKLENTTNGVSMVKEIFSKDISNSTIRRLVHKNGLRNYKKSCKPDISKKNIKARKAFYQKFKDSNFFKNNLLR